jgi:phosphohistidine phosphatase
MELYLIRHGLAHPIGHRNDFADEKRTLTSQGRDRMREVARGLRKLAVKPELILTSPFARATETAEIVADTLGVDKQMLLITANLAPGCPFEQLFAEIKDKRAESVALVGHEPDLGRIAGLILSGQNLSVPLRKAGVCRVDVTETVPSFRGRLAWLLTAKQLRIIGR